MQITKKIIHHGVWVILAIIIGILIVFLLAKGGNTVYSFADSKINELKQNLVKKDILKDQISPPQASKKTEPPLDYFAKDPDKSLEVSALVYLVGDLETGEIILSKNINETFPIASVSKLMTASLSDKDNELLYPLLLKSSNSTAEKIARNEGRDNFIIKMNQKAASLGLFNTAFKDPSGLSSSNISTASDLFKFARYLRKNENYIFEITNNTTVKVGNDNWININGLAQKKDFLGGKTGYTSAAQRTLVSIFEMPSEKDREIALILLPSTNRIKDVETILSYLKDNIYYGERGDDGVSLVVLKENILEADENRSGKASLMFVGDIMMDRGVKMSIQKNFLDNQMFLFENMEYLKKADILFGNLEGPVSDKGKDLGNLYSFRMNPETISTLDKAGFDVLSVANNHAGDWGQEAFEDTLARFEESNILAVGGGLNETEAKRPKIINVNDLKIGFLGFSDVGPDWMKVEGEKPGILLTRSLDFTETIRGASQQVDLLVVTFHFGDEYVEYNERQEKLAHLAIDSGAKIIIGHHPHVEQATEFYNGGIIAYSLGNFIFDQYFSDKTMKGLMLEIEIEEKKIKQIIKKTVQLNQFYQPSLTSSEIITPPEDVVNLFLKNTINDKKGEISIEIGWVGDIFPFPNKETQLGEDIFSDVKSVLKEPDIMIGNLEGVLTDNGTSKCDYEYFNKETCFTFRGSPSFANELSQAGFDVINLSNNHNFDYGQDGYLNTISVLDRSGLSSVRDKNIITKKIDNFDIAIVGFSTSPRSASLLDYNEIENLIKQAKKQADLVIALFHGGAEGVDKGNIPDSNEFYLDEDRGNLRKAARVAVDSGADLVVGSGPHILRGMEFYNGKLIAYSLGNFAGDKSSRWDKSLETSAMLMISLKNNGEWNNGKIIPIKIDSDGHPKISKTDEAISQINNLSKEDFAQNSVIISKNGEISPPIITIE